MAIWLFIRHFDKEAHQQLTDETDIQVALTLAGLKHGARILEPLTKLCHELGARITRVNVSPFYRTKQTAELLRPAWPNAKVVIEERLRELKQGVLHAVPFSELASRYPAYWQAIQAPGAMARVAPPLGECHAERCKDVGILLAEAAARQEDEAFITHAGILDCVHQLTYGTSDDEVVARWAANDRPGLGSVLACRHENGQTVPLFHNKQLCEPF